MRPELIMIDEQREGDLSHVTVVLIHEGDEIRGEASGPPDASHQLELICQATLDAARSASEKALDLEFAGMAITDVHSKPVAMALVRVAGGDSVFVGTAQVRQDGAMKAVSRAIMDAVNRPLFG